MRARVAYFLALCTLLVVVQLRAEIVQVAGGYRPFGHPPERVAFSWDMFAVDLQRCVVSWDPPLPLEWDTVMYVSGYERVAKEACRYQTAPATVVKLECPSTSGEVREIAFSCP
jgi:hypothetical protein